MRLNQNGGALLLVAPLVQVAWADGHVTDGERLSVLEVAASGLIDVGGTAYDELLELLWHRPSQEFFARGLEAVRSAIGALPFREAFSMEHALIAGLHQDRRHLAVRDGPRHPRCRAAHHRSNQPDARPGGS